MVFLEIISCCVKLFRNYNNFKLFKKFFLNSRKRKNSKFENIDDFRKVQRQNYCKLAEVSLKPFISKKLFTGLYSHLFKRFGTYVHPRFRCPKCVSIYRRYIPESLRWLWNNGEYTRANKTILKIADENKTSEKLSLFPEVLSIETDDSQNTNCCLIFRRKSLLHYTFIMAYTS